MLYPGSRFRMADELLETYIRQTIEAQRSSEITIAWQGGEPTLMGLDFFRRSIELEQKYLRPGQTIQNTLQTNGVKLDDEWCEFFREHNFLIGLSLDGTREMNDAYRVDKSGAGTFDRVVGAARLMQLPNAECNMLSTNIRSLRDWRCGHKSLSITHPTPPQACPFKTNNYPPPP